jgi:ABC-type transporter Mla MlaB component
VFNFGISGEYLPLVWSNTHTVNYPGHSSFGLHTVVGTTDPASAEAINCLPAVVSASLVGVDKRNQNGYDWVLMSEEWFNRRPSQNVYKNHPVDDTGDDWWYETMPNVFFYQLNYLYPATGDFNYQFTSVADRWLEALEAMGGSGTPWQIPGMDHRGWYLQTMTPDDQGVHEPEAAGAIAWLLYDAYVKTGNERYRIGAEWAMESLDRGTSNPAYELQLSYGAYLAARMNAETDVQVRADGFVRVALRGRLDAQTVVACWDNLEHSLRDAKIETLQVDASGLRFCDGAGRALLRYLNMGRMTPKATVSEIGRAHV